MKQDRRIRHTKSALKKGLLELLKEKPIEKVSVKELCDRADVNRSTFYVYFGSVQELLDSIMDEMYAEIALRPQDFDLLQDFLLSICESLWEYRDLMLIIAESSDFIRLLFRVTDIWEETFMAFLRKANVDDDRAALLYRFISTGAVFTLGTWVVSGGMRKSAHQVAAELEQVILNGINSYFT